MAGLTMEDTMAVDLARPLLLPTPPSSVVNDPKDDSPLPLRARRVSSCGSQASPTT